MTDIAGLPVRIFRHPRARRIRLALDPATRSLRLSLPRRGSLDRALDWAAEQRPWIERELARLAPPLPIVDGANIPFSGTVLHIRHDPTRRRGCALHRDDLYVGGPIETLAATVIRWLRREALATLSADTAEFAARAGVGIARVTVTETRSRWGSCTSGGVIRYSWRLICAPPMVRRATAAHEVAHRLHMDHSAAFHAAVARIADSPADAALSRDWLRANGPMLHGIGGPAPG